MLSASLCPFWFQFRASYSSVHSRPSSAFDVRLFPPGGNNDQYEYYYSDEGDSPQQQQEEANPVKVGHTFEMLPHPRIDKFGMSPLPLSHMDIANLHDEKQASGLVSPPHSAVVYRLHDIHTVFLALLLIQVHCRLSI